MSDDCKGELRECECVSEWCSGSRSKSKSRRGVRMMSSITHSLIHSLHHLILHKLTGYKVK
jgi:hypothetical protein